MRDQNTDRLLEESLSGDLPGQAFRARALLDSTEAFVRARRSRALRRFAALSAAAVFLIAASFLLGRYSVPQPSAEPAGADAADMVVVPSEFVAWVNAARLFKQLGMEDRVARALDRAGKLMPQGAAGPNAGAEPVFAGEEAAGANREERPDGAEQPDRREAFPVLNRVMAQYSGD